MSTQAEVRYEEVDTTGAEYANYLSERELQMQEEQRVRDAERQAREAVLRQLEVESVKFVLDRMNARAVLQAVRDEVWQEGEIVDIEGEKVLGLHDTSSYRAGISLVSGPFPLIEVHGTKDNRSLNLKRKEGHLSLDVLVGLSRDNEGQLKGTRVSVKDKQFCLTTTSKVPNLEGLIRLGGHLDALYAIQQIHNQFEGLDSYFDPGKSDAYRVLCYSVRKSVDARRKNASLPGQLRSWSEGLIGQFPLMLREEGSMDYPHLRAWEHQIRGSKRLVVLRERLLGRSA